MPEAATSPHSGPKDAVRPLRWGLLALGSWLALGFGCDPNPGSPTAVPPPPAGSPEDPPKPRPQNPLINRD